MFIVNGCYIDGAVPRNDKETCFVLCSILAQVIAEGKDSQKRDKELANWLKLTDYETFEGLEPEERDQTVNQWLPDEIAMQLDRLGTGQTCQWSEGNFLILNVSEVE
jgi:hypothetical protein